VIDRVDRAANNSGGATERSGEVVPVPMKKMRQIKNLSPALIRSEPNRR
jgi:hypothetical protein